MRLLVRGPARASFGIALSHELEREAALRSVLGIRTREQSLIFLDRDPHSKNAGIAAISHVDLTHRGSYADASA